MFISNWTDENIKNRIKSSIILSKFDLQLQFLLFAIFIIDLQLQFLLFVYQFILKLTFINDSAHQRK